MGGEQRSARTGRVPILDTRRRRKHRRRLEPDDRVIQDRSAAEVGSSFGEQSTVDYGDSVARPDTERKWRRRSGIIGGQQSSYSRSRFGARTSGARFVRPNSGGADMFDVRGESMPGPRNSRSAGSRDISRWSQSHRSTGGSCRSNNMPAEFGFARRYSSARVRPAIRDRDARCTR